MPIMYRYVVGGRSMVLTGFGELRPLWSLADVASSTMALNVRHHLSLLPAHPPPDFFLVLRGDEGIAFGRAVVVVVPGPWPALLTAYGMVNGARHGKRRTARRVRAAIIRNSNAHGNRTAVGCFFFFPGDIYLRCV